MEIPVHMVLSVSKLYDFLTILGSAASVVPQGVRKLLRMFWILRHHQAFCVRFQIRHVLHPLHHLNPHHPRLREKRDNLVRLLERPGEEEGTASARTGGAQKNLSRRRSGGVAGSGAGSLREPRQL